MAIVLDGTAGIVASGNVTANNFFGNTFAATANISAGNLATSGQLQVTGNTTVGNLTVTGTLDAGDITVDRIANGTSNIDIVGSGGNVTTSVGGVPNVLIVTSTGANIAGTVNATGNANVGNLGTTGLITATGNVSGGNLNTSGLVAATGNVSGGNLTTGGALNATGNANVGNLGTAGIITATGTITAGNLLVSGNVLGNLVPSANVTYDLGSATQRWRTLYLAGNTIDLGGQSITANATGVQLTGNLAGNNVTTPGFVIATGNITGGNLITAGVVDATGNVTGGNITTTNTITGGNVIVNSLGNQQLAISSDGKLVGGPDLVWQFSNARLWTTGIDSNGTISTSGLISATGNVSGGNLTTTGNVAASYFIGNGSQLTGIDATAIQNGSANVKTFLNANVAISAAGTSNVVVVTGTGANVAGTIDATGNISASYFIGNGSQLTGIDATLIQNGTANVKTFNNGNVAISAAGTSNVVVVTGTGANIAGTLNATGNANVGNLGATNIVGTLTTAAQPNITSLGVLNGIIVSTSVTADLFKARTGSDLPIQVVGANANILIQPQGTGSTDFNSKPIGNISTISASGNANVGNLGTTGLITATGNVSGGNLTTSGRVDASGNIAGGNVSGTNGTFTNIAGTLTTASQTNITAVGTLGSLNVTGNANVGNISATAGVFSGTGSFSGNINMNSQYINNVTNPVQNQDVATKSYVDQQVSTGVAYHEPVAVATTTTLAVATGGTVAYVEVNGAGNGVGAKLTTTGTFNLIDSANVQTVGTRILVKDEANTAWNGVYTYANTTSIVRSTDADEYGPNSVEQLSLNDYFFTQGGTVNEGISWVVNSPTGTITFGTTGITFAQFSTSQVYDAGTGLTLTNTTFSVNASQTQVTAVGTLGSLAVSGNANVGYLRATGGLNVTGSADVVNLLVTGNVLGALIPSANVTYDLGSPTQRWRTLYLAGNTLDLGGQSLSANAAGIQLTGNVSGNNLSTTGVVTATGNITATANVTGGNITTTGVVSATGNVSGGNLTTTGVLSVTGNANVGNLGATSIVGTLTTAAQTNITSVGTLTGLTVNGQGTFNNVLIAQSSPSVNNQGAWIGWNQSAGGGETNFINQLGLGSVGGFNWQTSTNLNARTTIATLTGAGALNVTGNVTGGNLTTAGLITSTGNITSSGNISASYFIGNGSQLTGIDATLIQNGSANVKTILNGNVVMSAGGVANVVTVTSTGANITGTLNATGNANVGNLGTAGLITATGNITATANITGGNITTAGLITATGNITGGNLLGVHANGTSNVNIPAINGNVNTSVGGVANVLVVTSTGANITGTFNTTGNANVGNLGTAGLITATGNITGGNLLGVHANGTSNVNIPTINGNVAISVGGTSNVLVATTTGVVLAGTLTFASGGNVSAGNILNINSNGVGNIGNSTNYFNTVFAKATSAQYADIAEMYVADAYYEPGTVLSFGGTHEVTLSTVSCDARIAGVVSQNPSYLMNSTQSGEHVAAVALTGRVPTFVKGPVSKGDMMVSAGNGMAMSCSSPQMGTVIGKALEDFTGSQGKIELVVGRL